MIQVTIQDDLQMNLYVVILDESKMTLNYLLKIRTEPVFETNGDVSHRKVMDHRSFMEMTKEMAWEN